MSVEDQNEFLHFCREHIDSIDESPDVYWFLMVGDCPIQLLHSKCKDDVLISGRIAIATHGFQIQCNDAERAEKVFKKLRNWIKKRYNNHLNCRSIYGEGKTSPVKNFWVGTDAIRWKAEKNERLFKQLSFDGAIVFEFE